MSDFKLLLRIGCLFEREGFVYEYLQFASFAQS